MYLYQAYWWYTIKYTSSNNLIAKFQYYTYMNNLALILNINFLNCL